ncbi:tyrosine-type recombinase/integrase [Flavobacterium sp. WV_118_3]|uniref:site-specific integrase n=1 Tax=Flavobacterium sp. WV_118_3 TaxID=3151764 RepID=UPI00321A49D6
MKNNQKLSILFWLFKAKATKKDGKAPLYARVTINSRSEEISMQSKVHPNNWDVINKKDTAGTLESQRTNKKVKEAEIDLYRHFMSLTTTFDEVTPIMLKNVYNGKDPLAHQRTDTSTGIRTILEAFDNYIKNFKLKVDKGKRSNGTHTHWNTARNKVANFICVKYGQPDLELTSIKYSFAESLFDYLTLEADVILAENTAKGYIKKTRQILKRCAKNELIKSNPIQEFVCNAEDPEVIPLELSQINRMLQKSMPAKVLEEIRDVFIFQCFTGFSYADLYKLSKECIKEVGLNGEKWIAKQRDKTDVNEMVPLLPLAQKIIEKYESHPSCLKKGLLLPVDNNSRYNRYLKEIANICGINKRLHTHLARHTFADLMLNSDMPLEDVSKLLGHKSIRTTQKYAKIRKNRISRNLKRVREDLFTDTGELKTIG